MVEAGLSGLHRRPSAAAGTLEQEEETIMTMRKSLMAGLAVAMIAGTAHAQVVDKKALTLAAAKKIAAAAEADAKAKGARVVIVVVDDGGNLLLLERLDDTQVASVNVGIGRHEAGRSARSGDRQEGPDVGRSEEGHRRGGGRGEAGQGARRRYRRRGRRR